jgi:hypothetical protein
MAWWWKEVVVRRSLLEESAGEKYVKAYKPLNKDVNDLKV